MHLAYCDSFSCLTWPFREQCGYYLLLWLLFLLRCWLFLFELLKVAQWLFFFLLVSSPAVINIKISTFHYTILIFLFHSHLILHFLFLIYTTNTFHLSTLSLISLYSPQSLLYFPTIPLFPCLTYLSLSLSWGFVGGTAVTGVLLSRIPAARWLNLWELLS